MSWFRPSGPEQAPAAPAPSPELAPAPEWARATDRAAVRGALGGTVAPDAAGDRRLLIDLVIYAFDRARTPAVQQRLTAGLAEIGVQVIRPDGGLFDPGAQEAGGVLPTSDPALHNVIAETESAGFRDGERIVREPVVVVYRLTAGEEPVGRR